MKKLWVTALICACVAVGHGGLIGVGLDYVDTTYTADTKVFAMGDTGLLAILQHEDGTQSALFGVSLELSATFVSGMSFGSGQFLMSDGTGTLLSGTVDSLVFTHGDRVLGGEGTATVVQSALDGFAAGPAEIISISFNLNPEFAGFNQDYTGDSKINFQVPEPATLALLGLGGLLLRKRK